jgi:hypothetical protein
MSAPPNDNGNALFCFILVDFFFVEKHTENYTAINLFCNKTFWRKKAIFSTFCSQTVAHQ